MSNSRPLKIMIVTDSAGNPRSFPVAERVHLEETFPYLIRAHFPNATFWQLSFGSQSSLSLLSQPMGYLTHWNPDFIIVQSGMQDCHPTVLSDFQREFVKRVTWRFSKWILPRMNHPFLFKHFSKSRETKSSFRRALRQFKMVFPTSKIFWVGIGANEPAIKAIPGLKDKMADFNEVAKEVYGDGFVGIQERISQVQGFNGQDHMHWNKRGHDVIAAQLIKLMEEQLSLVKVDTQ